MMSASTGKTPDKEKEIDTAYANFLRSLRETVHAEFNFHDQTVQLIKFLRKIDTQKVKDKNRYFAPMMLTAIKKAQAASKKTFQIMKDIRDLVSEEFLENASKLSNADIRKGLEKGLFSKETIEIFIQKLEALKAENTAYTEGLSEANRIFSLYTGHAIKLHMLTSIASQRLTRFQMPLNESIKELSRIKKSSSNTELSRLISSYNTLIEEANKNAKRQDARLESDQILFQKSKKNQNFSSKVQKLLDTAGKLERTNLKINLLKPRTKARVEKFKRRQAKFLERYDALSEQEKKQIPEVIQRVFEQAKNLSESKESYEKIDTFTLTAKNARFSASNIQNELKPLISRLKNKPYKIDTKTNTVLITTDNDEPLIYIKKIGTNVSIKLDSRARKALGYLSSKEKNEIYGLLNIAIRAFYHSLKRPNVNPVISIQTKSEDAFKASVPVEYVSFDNKTQKNYKAAIHEMETAALEKLEIRSKEVLKKILDLRNKTEQHLHDFESDANRVMSSDVPTKFSASSHQKNLSEVDKLSSEHARAVKQLQSLNNQNIQHKLTHVLNQRGVGYALNEQTNVLNKLKNNVENIEKIQRNADIQRTFRKDIKDATAALEKLKHNLPKLQFEDLKKYKDYFAILRKHIEDLESDARELNRVGIFNPEQGKDFKKTLVDIKTNLDKLESQFKDIKKELERRATSQRTNAHLGGPGIGPSQNFLLSQPGISTREFTSHVQKVLGAQLALFYTRHHNILSSKVKTDALLDTLKEWTEQINSARNNPRYQNNKELKKQIEKAKFDLEALSKAVQTAQKHRPSL